MSHFCLQATALIKFAVNPLASHREATPRDLNSEMTFIVFLKDYIFNADQISQAFDVRKPAGPLLRPNPITANKILLH